MDEAVPARDLLDLTIVRPAGGRRLARWTAVVASNLALQGSGLQHPGGSTAVVTERRTGRTVCEVTEEIDADGTSEFARMIDDYQSAAVEEFLARWTARSPES